MTHSGPPRTRTGAWILVTILLLVAVLGTLIVPIYARSTPKLGSFPFFYWYQLIWVPVVALLTTICYLITTRVARPPADRRPSWSSSSPWSPSSASPRHGGAGPRTYCISTSGGSAGGASAPSSPGSCSAAICILPTHSSRCRPWSSAPGRPVPVGLARGRVGGRGLTAAGAGPASPPRARHLSVPRPQSAGGACSRKLLAGNIAA